MLAVVGLYGVVSTSVAERTRELGIRRALGASSLELVRSVVLAALVLAGIGVIAGVGMALASAELLRHFLYGVSATDMRTLLASGALMLAVAAAASVVPALRALRVNPAETLRAE